MMTAQPLNRWPKWRDQLVYHLRTANVPGDRIGDILLEVESHVTETGETPTEAFGSAKDYAQSRAAAHPSDREVENDMSALIIAALSFLGSLLYVSGALELGKGSESIYLFPPLIVLIVGAGILAYGIFNLPQDLVRHPVTKEPLLGDSPSYKWILAGVLVAVGIVFYVIGRMLS